VSDGVQFAKWNNLPEERAGEAAWLCLVLTKYIPLNWKRGLTVDGAQGRGRSVKRRIGRVRI
jgi:hypothetical protein